MAINNFTQNMNIIAALGNEPNTDNALSPAQLKAEFDKAGNYIKTYINGTLIPDVLAEIATGGFTPGGTYDPATTYAKNTMITYNNTVYVTLIQVQGITPTDDHVNYVLLIAPPSVTLGNNSTTAYRGDYGEIAYNHSQLIANNPHNVTVDMLGAVPNTRTIQNKALSNNITLTYFDIGAAPVQHSHGNIANNGSMGATGNLPIMTGTNGILEVRAVNSYRNSLGLGDTNGPVPITAGGTNANTAAGALAQLGITYGLSDMNAGNTALNTGAFYFVYE